MSTAEHPTPHPEGPPETAESGRQLELRNRLFDLSQTNPELGEGMWQTSKEMSKHIPNPDERLKAKYDALENMLSAEEQLRRIEIPEVTADHKFTAVEFSDGVEPMIGYRTDGEAGLPTEWKPVGEMVATAPSFAELAELADTLQAIPGSEHVFTGQEVAQAIMLVEHGAPTKHVTHTYGLRDAAKRLIADAPL